MKKAIKLIEREIEICHHIASTSNDDEVKKMYKGMSVEYDRAIAVLKGGGRKAQFGIGDMVYLKTDVNQSERIIVGVIFREGSQQYILGFGESESWHYECEISMDRDVVKATSN